MRSTPSTPASLRVRLARGALLLAVSALGHAAVLPLAARVGEPPERPLVALSLGLTQRVEAVAGPVSVAAARRELVEGARADRAAGRLVLGEFLLQASALDARAEGRPLDLGAARARWTARLAQLRQGLSRVGPERAVPEAFGDLHYIGRAGGSMGRALLEGGGSCEPLSHLIAAGLHDAGLADRAFLRFYGGGSAGGATHLAPILADERAEHDLITGTPARPGGARFPAADLVEAYARTHGLAPALVEPGGGQGDDPDAASPDGPEPPASTMAAGYPPNQDRFPGATPFYADRAVVAPAQAAIAARAPAVDVADCAFFARVATLDPPEVTVAGAREGYGVELRRVPTGAQMDRIFGVVQAVERALAAPADPAESLMGQACLTALYDQAALGFGLRGERDLAIRATARRREAAAAGEAALAAVDWDGPEGGRVLARLTERYAGRSWLLLLLRGGEAPVLRLGRDAAQDSWARTSTLAALLIAPGTRPVALGLVDGLSPRQKIEIMHEVFHAHDHQRPWASNYALDGAGEGEFARVYRVFRGLAWGLWEGARPQGEVLAALLRDAARERIGRDWLAVLIDYYGRNALALHQHRADGPEIAVSLERWLREQGFTELDVYRRAAERLGTGP